MPMSVIYEGSWQRYDDTEALRTALSDTRGKRGYGFGDGEPWLFSLWAWALIVTARVQGREKHVAGVAIACTWRGSLASPPVIVKRHSTRYRRNMRCGRQKRQISWLCHSDAPSAGQGQHRRLLRRCTVDSGGFARMTRLRRQRRRQIWRRGWI